MNKVLIWLAFTLSAGTCPGQKYEVSSPDGRVMVIIEVNRKILYQVQFDGKEIILPSEIDLQLLNTRLSLDASVKRTKRRQVSDQIIPVVQEKRKVVKDHYNELAIEFKKPFSVIFRAYDDGIAYRFLTHFRDTIIIEHELAEVKFPHNPQVYYSSVVPREGTDIFHTSFEEPYQLKTLDSISKNDLIFSPLLVMPANGPKILLTESDLEDYPGMFMTGNNNAGLYGKFAPFPLEERMTEGEFPQYIVTRRAGYIARTSGNRSYPWRVIAIAKKDTDLPSTDIVYRLASPSRLKNTEWIHPGKGTDEWIIGINLFNVPFRSGINTATYKYYIDFAKRFGFDRIMLDAGWSDYKDLFKINPSLDMDEIAAYARKQGIKLSMWTLALTLDRQLEKALEQFNKWGVDFIMTDFMDRDDQQMVNFYFRIAEACAKYKIMIMYHGAFKPAGFGRTYPNAITREGVLGSEYNIWSDKPTPRHNVLLPFIRMVSGPMDYEPGILDNATQKTFRPVGEKVMAQGTRCHQLAMFVVYESPIQIFSGNPSTGMQEPAFMELLGSIPTTWDETNVIDGKVGEYIITSRKKGSEWFIGGMTDWTSREMNLSLHFLEPGEYEATICEDGVNADRYPSDYILFNKKVTDRDSLPLHLAPGGGFMIRIRKQSF